MNRIDVRRRRVTGLAMATALAPLFRISPAFAQALKISVGTALSQEGGAVVLRMQGEKLLEKAAQELGMAGVEAEYLGFTVLLRMLQGLVAGQLQIGMIGSRAPKPSHTISSAARSGRIASQRRVQATIRAIAAPGRADIGPGS